MIVTDNDDYNRDDDYHDDDDDNDEKFHQTKSESC